MAKKVDNIVFRFLKKILTLVGKTDFNDRIFLVSNLRYVLFVSAIALFYIANTHYAERNLRQINTLQKELRELESQYMTSKSELMYKSKLTEVAKLVRPYGLQELTKPPQKIVIGD
ncbi:MAG: FtsL-like putative cell division protein [Chitinophagales bacterium]